MEKSEIPPAWLDKVLIRPGRRTDLIDLEWEGEYSHLRQVYARAFEMTRNGRSAFWIAEIGGKGVIGQGFLQYNSNRQDLANGFDLAYLFSFRIKPDFRNHGIGSRLLYQVENELRKRSFMEISLIVSRKNLRAIQFYHHHDFTIVAPESGEWTFEDHLNRRIRIQEPGWKMIKNIS